MTSHLAAIEFSANGFVTDAQRDRADAIAHRRTDRLPLATPTQWDSFEPLLRSTLDESIATIDVLTDDVRPQLAEASRFSEALRRYDSFYHAELQWWATPLPSCAVGIPPSALASQTEQRRVGVAHGFPSHTGDDRRPTIARDAAKILVLSTPDDTRRDALCCGEALSTVLLECTMAGMATCTLTHMMESETSRDVVRKLIANRGEPQVLIRIGIAPPTEQPPDSTPRRPLTEVLEIQ